MVKNVVIGQFIVWYRHNNLSQSLLITEKHRGIIQTICGTGIRVSELQFITVEAVKKGEAVVSLKGKTRTVFIVKDLQKNSADDYTKNCRRHGSRLKSL